MGIYFGSNEFQKFNWEGVEDKVCNRLTRCYPSCPTGEETWWHPLCGINWMRCKPPAGLSQAIQRHLVALFLVRIPLGPICCTVSSYTRRATRPGWYKGKNNNFSFTNCQRWWQVTHVQVSSKSHISTIKSQASLKSQYKQIKQVKSSQWLTSSKSSRVLIRVKSSQITVSNRNKYIFITWPY